MFDPFILKLMVAALIVMAVMVSFPTFGHMKR
jgi:hypothetical protein